ncbi:hypothetical protein HMPREF1544_02190 [Mucor circinelloides 1006PhL]|uniref:Uncharacterized protein n=1 Tax=Mucor circinelloides f. circinelloides (strain 1006PhL) TaxID=1220926 RepID=S2JKU1_MUCC1|nr:hypothetical protein HMPREF1544_02190 [Mucor circinelloides 1006PhL]
MDILQYYSEGNKKFRFSTFVEDLKEDIAAHSLEIDVAGDNDWKALKEAWSSILKRFKTQNADVESRSLPSEDVFAFSTDTKISNIIYKQAVEAARCKLNYTNDLSKQDLLYFRILDFSLKKEANPLLTVFNKTDYDRFKAEFTTKIPISTYVGNTSKSYLARVEGTENKKQMIKLIKEEVMAEALGAEGDETVLCHSYFFGLCNEDSYLYFVLSPMFKNLLLNNPRNCLIFGETNLKAKAIEVNRYLDDDERRFSGPKIDLIIKDKKYNLEIMTVEVSGPPQKVNQTHFLEDRNKTAKNLKAMFKQIVSRMEVPSVTLIRKLKLYGLQFYQNEVFIYSLSKPCDYSNVFVKDSQFSVLGESSISKQSMPTFFKNFPAISHLIEATHVGLDEIFSIDENQEVLEESSEDPSPHVSPRKKNKKQVLKKSRTLSVFLL